jgi:hypothetical protein
LGINIKGRVMKLQTEEDLFTLLNIDTIIEEILESRKHLSIKMDEIIEYIEDTFECDELFCNNEVGSIIYEFYSRHYPIKRDELYLFDICSSFINSKHLKKPFRNPKG